MQDRHLCCPPYFFSGPAVPPPTFFILESPLPESQRDLITTTVNLNRKLAKLGWLIFFTEEKKIKFTEENENFSMTHIDKSNLSFSQCRNENQCVSRRGICRPQSGRIPKYVVKLLEFQARCDHLQELKPCFAFLVNPFNVNVSVMAVQLANRL